MDIAEKPSQQGTSQDQERRRACCSSGDCVLSLGNNIVVMDVHMSFLVNTFWTGSPIGGILQSGQPQGMEKLLWRD